MSAPLSAAERAAERFTDGEWHRLHPATPLLRGGIVFVAILGFVLSNLRERIVGIFIGTPDYGGDPIDQIYDHGWEGWALLAIVVVLLLCLGAFYLSWRMHSFRITGDAVEVRSGILFRTQRKARLDRIQGINIVRPVLARIFGAAKLDISVAGHDANVQLAYLGSSLADGLRGDVLRLASGVRASEAESRPPEVTESFGEPGPQGGMAGPDGSPAGVQGAAAAGGAVSGLVTRRVNEFIAPELDPTVAPPQSVVKIPPLRLLGSLVLSGFTIFLLVVVALLVIGVSTGRVWLLFVVLPGLLGSASFYINRFTKSLRYSIAGTPDGVRVGFGLLSLSNETLPPGRIHAVEVLQPLLWRPFGWWQIRIDTAGHSKEKGAAGQPNTTMLPVGDAADVARVLGLVLPDFATDAHRELIVAGMTSRGRDSYIGSPRRAAWVRPLSWRRNGYSIVDGVILLRRGAVWRSLAMVPLARLQSLEIQQGPIDRMLGLAGARLHTVSGPVRPRLAALDAPQSVHLFDDVAAGAIASAQSDRSHRWAELPFDQAAPLDAPTPPSTPTTTREEHP
ncbi:PH domain-containing protein [Leifsonia sp. PS1209]|uniref:PH domain-containing protein n=1 Tax=Leifsonia sp. PS1209 TaxID=2724914 RepID=UPI001442D0B1|nr:PH domain-containing protein [Leifsonia sp. PS1209]QIZ99862.1 PH domain-containing protein [Leifsonia sp. PS1209]